MVRHHNTPVSSPKRHPSSPILASVASAAEGIVTGQQENENNNKVTAEKLKAGLEVSPSSPPSSAAAAAAVAETPARQVLSKISNNRDLHPSSPGLSPSGTVSGKLIKLFEELSKANSQQSPSRSADSSPSPSGRVDGGTTMGQMLQTARMTMDGLDETVDEGEEKEVMLEAQMDGALDNPDGLDECF